MTKFFWNFLCFKIWENLFRFVHSLRKKITKNIPIDNSYYQNHAYEFYEYFVNFWDNVMNFDDFLLILFLILKFFHWKLNNSLLDLKNSKSQFYAFAKKRTFSFAMKVSERKVFQKLKYEFSRTKSNFYQTVFQSSAYAKKPCC